MDDNSEKKLAAVHPILAERVRQTLAKLGGDYRVVQGLRTAAEQNALYAEGRTAPGEIVTRAKAWESNHSFGLAVDIAPFVNGQPDWKHIPAFITMGHTAESFGLEWGGDWHKFLDLPHVQLPGLTIKQCQQLYKQGGLPAVWKRASELNGDKNDAPTPVVADIISEPISAHATIEVVAGDTLSGLAKKHGTTVEAIKKLNNLTSDAIKIGQELAI